MVLGLPLHPQHYAVVVLTFKFQEISNSIGRIFLMDDGSRALTVSNGFFLEMCGCGHEPIPFAYKIREWKT